MSFDPTLSTDRDRARFRLGDVGEPPYFPDSTYDAVLAGSDSYDKALVTLAQGLSGYFRSMPGGDLKLGDQTVSFEGMAQMYADLAAELRRDLPINGARAGLIGCERTREYRHDALCEPPFGWPFGPRSCLP